MDFNSAKKLLMQENLTCIIFHDDDIYTSSERGVKPLLKLIDAGKSCKGHEAVDKVIGKAAAFLYVILGVTKIHAGVISQSALQVLRDNQITITYDKLVGYIENRTKDGRCPMESAVLHIDDCNEALAAIRQKVKELNGGKSMSNKFFGNVKKNFGFGCMRLR